MPDRYCVATTVSGHYQYFIPPFVYSINKVNPDCKIKIFLKEELHEEIRECKHLRNLEVEDNWNCDVPEFAGTWNSLRFLFQRSDFSQIDFVYITDVDFVMLSHDPWFGEYYRRKLRDWQQPYWGLRGLKKEGDKRIAGGAFFIRWPDWFDRTERLRRQYSKGVRAGKLGREREDDERILWNLVAGSGLKCPTKRLNKRNAKYKDIHLGDFKFPERWQNQRRMDKRIRKTNFHKFFRLEEDEKWRECVELACENKVVKNMFSNLRAYMENRRREIEESRLHSPDV